MDIANFTIVQWYILIIILGTIMFLTKYDNKVICIGTRSFCSTRALTTIVCALIMIGLASLRTGIGDTSNYISIFHKIPSEWIEFKSFVDWDGEWGFYLLNYVIKYVAGDNVNNYLFVTSSVIIGSVVFFSYKNTNNVELCVLIYILSGSYVSGMNGVRQAFVAGCFVLSYQLIQEKKYVIYVLICLLLLTIHTSAFILIPMIWILNLKPWKTGTFCLLGLSMVLYVAYPVFSGFLTRALAGSAYEVYSNGIENFTNGGANMLRAIILFVPIIMSYIYREQLEKKYRLFGMVLNASVLNFMFMFLATVRSWIFARFCLYFNPFSVLLLIWCIELSGKSKKILYPTCLGAYAVFFYFEMITTVYAAL